MKKIQFEKFCSLKNLIRLAFAISFLILCCFIATKKAGSFDFDLGDFSTKFPVQKSKAIY